MARFFKRRPRDDPEVVETPPVVSPAVSRVSSLSPFPAATPGAVSESADDYFSSALREVPTNRSYLSVPGSRDGRPPQRLSDRPYVEGRLRAPSIRLRRVSNSSLNSSNRNSLVSNDGQDAWDNNRQRSISQPERARVHDGPPIAMHSARVPQVALPRLTEEGGRPSLAELGLSPGSPYPVSPLPTSPLTPTLSLPDQRTSNYQDQAQQTRMQRARNISKAFWPPYHRHSKNQDQQVQEGLDPLDPDSKLEYANDLVDWLDTIGW